MNNGLKTDKALFHTLFKTDLYQHRRSTSLDREVSICALLDETYQSKLKLRKRGKGTERKINYDKTRYKHLTHNRMKNRNKKNVTIGGLNFELTQVF